MPKFSLTANVSQVPKRSPFRYPGGKTWMTPLLRLWLKNTAKEDSVFVEPFAGGASASLLAIDEGYCEQAHFAELDADVASVWSCILSEDGLELADATASFKVTKRSVTALLGPQRGRWSQVRKALAVLVRNRTQRGGVMAPGAGRLKMGEKGNGLRSRWYPETLGKRLQRIHALRTKLNFVEGDGFALLERFTLDPSAIAFVDPPYFVAAERLYACWEMDHRRLFSSLSNFAGNFLLAYDDAPQIREWVKEFGFEMMKVGMKTTNHASKHELIIGRNLDVLNQRPPKSSHSMAAAVHVRSRTNSAADSRPAA